MKVQALKDLVLSILWAEACVSIWVFLHSGIWEEIVWTAGVRNLAKELVVEVANYWAKSTGIQESYIW